MRKKLLEFREKLCRERLVVRHDERRTLDLLDDVCHGERLSGAGDAHQILDFLTGADPVNEFLDRLRLVT